MKEDQSLPKSSQTPYVGGEFVLVHRSGGSSLQVLPDAYNMWDAYLYSFGEDGHIRIKKIGESQNRQELVLRCVAAFGRAYRWGDWYAPVWTLGMKSLSQAEAEAFVSELVEVSA